MLRLEQEWDRRVESWHSHVTSAAAFEQVLGQLVRLAAPAPADTCVDLGAGTGFVTTALAPLVSSVTPRWPGGPPATDCGTCPPPCVT